LEHSDGEKNNETRSGRNKTHRNEDSVEENRGITTVDCSEDWRNENSHSLNIKWKNAVEDELMKS
jgi:hypothetical protein